MIYQVIAVYDSKARAFLPPFTCAHIDLGRRAFADIANAPDHQIGRTPEDFTLYHLGTFDDETAEFGLLPQRVNLGLASSYKRPTIREVMNPPATQARANYGANDDVKGK